MRRTALRKVCTVAQQSAVVVGPSFHVWSLRTSARAHCEFASTHREDIKRFSQSKNAQMDVRGRSSGFARGTNSRNKTQKYIHEREPRTCANCLPSRKNISLPKSWKDVSQHRGEYAQWDLVTTTPDLKKFLGQECINMLKMDCETPLDAVR